MREFSLCKFYIFSRVEWNLNKWKIFLNKKFEDFFYQDRRFWRKTIKREKYFEKKFSDFFSQFFKVSHFERKNIQRKFFCHGNHFGKWWILKKSYDSKSIQSVKVSIIKYFGEKISFSTYFFGEKFDWKTN